MAGLVQHQRRIARPMIWSRSAEQWVYLGDYDDKKKTWRTMEFKVAPHVTPDELVDQKINPREDSGAYAGMPEVWGKQAGRWQDVINLLEKDVAVKVVRVERWHPPSQFRWALIEPQQLRVDVFWCEASGQDAHKLAAKLAAEISTAGFSSRVQLRVLSVEKNTRPGYHVKGYQVRHDSWEKGSADRLAGIAAATLGTAFQTSQVIRTPTWGYLSTFVCPARP